MEDVAKNVQIEEEETNDFIVIFLRSNVASIDAFLSRHDKLFEIGKVSIAAILRLKEAPEKGANKCSALRQMKHALHIASDVDQACISPYQFHIDVFVRKTAFHQ